MSMLPFVVLYILLIPVRNVTSLLFLCICLDFLAKVMRDVSINMIRKIQNGMSHYFKVWLPILLVLPDLRESVVHDIKACKPLLRILGWTSQDAVPKLFGEFREVLWMGWFILLH